MARTCRVAVCCDLATASGRLHVVRSLALAEELVLRGVQVVFVADVEADDWARMQIAARGLEAVPPVATADEHVDLVERLGADAVVFDTHRLPREVYSAVRDTGRPTLAAVDGNPRNAEADLLLDPNVGAEEEEHPLPRNCTRLAGLDYAPLRNDILANRPISAPVPASVEVPKVVVLLDETDMPDAGAWLARTLVATGRPFDATVVTPDPEGRERAEAVRPAPRQRIAAVAPDTRIAERVVRSDAVVAAAGPSTAELLCLGAAVGLVWVTDADVESYRQLMVQRAVIGLGSVEALGKEPDSGAEQAARLLSDSRERARLAESGWRRVDGLGRARVVDALVGLL